MVPYFCHFLPYHPRQIDARIHQSIKSVNLILIAACQNQNFLSMYIYEDSTIPLYFYSTFKIALIEILIELGTVTNGDLRLKVSE